MNNRDLKRVALIFCLVVSFSWVFTIIYQQNKHIERQHQIILSSHSVLKKLDEDNDSLRAIIKEQDAYSIMLENKINYYEEWNKILKDLSQHF